LCLLLLVYVQALGPQVVRTLLIPHLEPFMSSSLFPSMASEPAAANSSSSAASKDAQPQQQQQQLLENGSNAQEQQRKRTEQAQRQQQQQRAEAWQVYGALLSATGSAMYDRLIGQLQGDMPMHLLLARRSRPDMDWDSGLSKALVAAKQSGAAQDKGQQQTRRSMDAAAAAADDDDGAGADGAGATAAGATVNGVIAGSRDAHDAAAAAAAAESGGRAQQQQRQLRSLVGGGPAAAAARKRSISGVDQQQQQQQPSVAEVLGQSWKEDSDANATLGALLHLFGEDLLPSLPLAQLAAVSI
jgi:hypothetical protein